LRDAIVNRLKGAYRGFMVSTMLSLAGLSVDVLVYALYGSIILFTDLVHWAVDTAVELFGFVALYYAVKVGRRFPWSIVVLESAVMLATIVVALGVYLVFFTSYITTAYQAGEVTTTSLVSIVATVLGGILTFLALATQRRNYLKYGLEVLRVDYTHALIDIVAAAIATVGIALVYYTGDASLELLFVVISSMFIIHSLSEILRDILKTITGENIDHELSAKLLKKLINEFRRVDIEDVTARKIGSFYIVEVRARVNPKERLESLHRLRARITRLILEESTLVYHVDVRFFPAWSRRKR